MMRSIRALRLAFVSWAGRRFSCAWRVTPLVKRAADKRAAAHFTLVLKPNINQYSCACWGVAIVELGGLRCFRRGHLLIRTLETGLDGVWDEKRLVKEEDRGGRRR